MRNAQIRRLASSFQARCGEDPDHGYGRRKRSVDNAKNSTAADAANKIQKWEENLELKIRLPQDLVQSSSSSSSSSAITESECKLYLIVTLSVAMTFCVLSGVIVLVACVRRFQEVRARATAADKFKREQEAEEEARKEKEKLEMDRAAAMQQFASNKATFLPYMSRPPLDLAQFQQQHSAPHSSQQQKPVTVRSVKRRDKAKMEEKNRMNQQQIFNGAVVNNNFAKLSRPNGETDSNDDDEKAVMV